MKSEILRMIVLSVVVFIVIYSIVRLIAIIPANFPPCDHPRPSAGIIVDCIATRTAEAHK